ncbi:CPBP family intramembrane metalloprotease [Sphingobacterium corticibacter]|uniref:CPBP family intramembrane metalloprotease n=2 Tax=Sphingobacterium corticibacter TaxID=2171749 RepID=A0A2T8HIC5_9SPHI|nr:CPBP family intramembrane metalloprotease [Sphingobacterium corticibacter]
MNMHKRTYYLTFAIGFIVYFLVDSTLFSLCQKQVTIWTQSKALGHVIAYSITIIPLFLTTALLRKSIPDIPRNLGLNGNLLLGVCFAFLCTLPMLVAFTLKFELTSLSVETIIINTISSAFFEELIYRGFLFGMLYRFTRLGFLPAIFLGSLLFGVAHLYQSTDITELAGIFMITFLGSILFAWIYTEWNFNLWTAIFLHCFMNLYWLIFNVDDTALGGVYANVFRFTTIFLAIVGTIIYKKKSNIPMSIVRKAWWLK